MQVNNALPINDGYLCRLGLDMSIINPKIEELNALLSLGDFDLTPGHLDQICACIVLGDLVSTTLANGTIEVVQTIDFDSGTSRNGNLRTLAAVHNEMNQALAQPAMLHKIEHWWPRFRSQKNQSLVAS